jgi:hypothetical protein
MRNSKNMSKLGFPKVSGIFEHKSENLMQRCLAFGTPQPNHFNGQGLAVSGSWPSIVKKCGSDHCFPNFIIEL